MENEDQTESMTGGVIPGLFPEPAFSLSRATVSPIPVLIAVPHAGRRYPQATLEAMREPAYATMRLEDRYADRLGEEVARRTGAALLVAHAPRAMLDLNRAPDEIDWQMFVDAGPDEALRPHASRRARSGLGLFPRRLPGLGELWTRRLGADIVGERLAAIHVPYHAALGRALGSLRTRWGAALLLDLHSMPPLAPRRSGEPTAEFVIGDRFGATCDGALIGAAFGFLASAGRLTAHNRPYAGGYVLERHARPTRGIHALQLEIDRTCYLDEGLDQPGPGFSRTVDLLTGLVRRLAEETAMLGNGQRVGGAETWGIAAE